MKKVITTPAGRERYLKILFQYLKKYKNEFDYWDIWVNTVNPSDVEYIEKIGRENDFIRLRYLTVPFDGRGCGHTIYSFFKDCANPDEIYLRLDDDIVYVHPGAITRIFEERMKDNSSFLLYGNIINNWMTSYVHQRIGNIGYEFGVCQIDEVCRVGWDSGQFAESLHRKFLDKVETNSAQDFFFRDWDIPNCDRVSINAISWTGEEFSKFSGNVDPDEEVWLATIKPKEIGKINKIIGDAIFVHYAFWPQRAYLDSTDILSKYEEVANKICQ